MSASALPELRLIHGLYPSPYTRKVVVAARELGLDQHLKLEAATIGWNVPTSAKEGEIPYEKYNPTAKIAAPRCPSSDASQIPIFISTPADGSPPSTYFGSQNIIQYLDALAGGDKLLPAAPGPEGMVKRVDELVLEAISDGLLDASVLMAVENIVRPEALRWPEWYSGQRVKVIRALHALAARAPSPASASASFADDASTPADLSGARLADPEDPSSETPPLSVGNIAAACALWFLDLHFADEIKWREIPGVGERLAPWYDKVSQRPSWRPFPEA